MNLPNKLTVTRVLLVPFLILIYMFPYDSAGITVPVYHVLETNISLVNIIILFIFIIASITDYFDGKIARKEKLLASDKTINIIIPIIMISRDTIVDAIKMSAASKQVVVAASKLGKLKTVSQMIALGFLLVNNFPFTVLGVDVANALAWLATVISVISGIDYFLKNREMLTETM